jgi:hypothetical protein
MVMENLLKEGGKLPKNLSLEILGEPSPDTLHGAGHERLHSLTRERRSMRASLVSLVRSGDMVSRAREVASTGRRRRIPSR